MEYFYDIIWNIEYFFNIVTYIHIRLNQLP